MSNNTSSGFGQFVPGFEFLQNLASPSPAAGPGMRGMPHLGNWVAPTFNVEDLEKRIEELKAVHFWLDQNSKALSATIQAMEVQKMTLATLRDLNVNFGDLAKAGEVAGQAAAASMSKGFEAFDKPPAAEPAPAPESKPSAPPSAADAEHNPGAQDTIDPMQWWGALQQQFQSIAVNAMQELAKHEVPKAAKPAAKTQPKAAAKARAKPATPTGTTRATAVGKKKAPARARTRS